MPLDFLLAIILLFIPLSFALHSNVPSSLHLQQTPYSPFQYILLAVNRDTVDGLDPPSTCPLEQPSTLDSPELLSFEEWKAKQRVVVDQRRTGTSLDTQLEIQPTSNDSAPRLSPQEIPIKTYLSPFASVPLTDRFNYASTECSARVHSSHHKTQNPHHILSFKKDKYMLSPCSASKGSDGKKLFVVVELCDDIRIDTVQLANFEFFSGVFKDIRIRLAQNLPAASGESDEGWMEMGTFTGKNIRAVQTFHPLSELRPFYRYIRIDFLTHYGNEYYCPLSLLRVYGLTQMEEWKWEEWQSVHKSFKEPDVESAAAPKSNIVSETRTGENSVAATVPDASPSQSVVAITNLDHDPEVTVKGAEMSKTIDEPLVSSTQESILAPFTSRGSDGTPLVDQELAFSTSGSSIPALTQRSSLESVDTSAAISSARTQDVVKPTNPPNSYHTYSASDSISGKPVDPDPFPSSQVPHDVAPVVPNKVPEEAALESLDNSEKGASRSVSLLHSTPGSQQPAPSVTSGGESVFRTISNRLSVLEANISLYTQYLDEQTRSVRGALKKLEEEVGRIASLAKKDRSAWEKSMSDFIKRNGEMEKERKLLNERIDRLAGEIKLERRLGIGQFFLLFVVLCLASLNHIGLTGQWQLGANSGVGPGFGLLRHRHSERQRGTRSRVTSSADWGLLKWPSLSRSNTPDLASPVRDDLSSVERSEDEGEKVSTSVTSLQKERLSISPQISSFASKQDIPFPSRHRADSQGNPTTYGYKSFPNSTAMSRPITPSDSIKENSASTRPRMMHRSSSHSATAFGSFPFGVGDKGSVPIPAEVRMRRLAKTAHLHEVKNRRDRRPLRVLTTLDPQTTSSSHSNPGVSGLENTQLSEVNGLPQILSHARSKRSGRSTPLSVRRATSIYQLREQDQTITLPRPRTPNSWKRPRSGHPVTEAVVDSRSPVQHQQEAGHEASDVDGDVWMDTDSITEPEETDDNNKDVEHYQDIELSQRSLESILGSRIALASPPTKRGKAGGAPEPFL